MSRNLPRLLVFQGDDGNWRWHLEATNGLIVATSGESFDSRFNANRAALTAQRLFKQVVRVTFIEPVASNA